MKKSAFIFYCLYPGKKWLKALKITYLQYSPTNFIRLFVDRVKKLQSTIA